MENKDRGPSVWRVLTTDRLTGDLFRLAVQGPAEEVQALVPGQFAQIQIPRRDSLLLRRPMSVAGADPSRGSVAFLIREVGEGTRVLGSLRPGDALDILLPLGKGFARPDPGSRVWLVGGGAGVGAMSFYRSFYPQASARAFYGFENVGELGPAFEARETQYATMDGTLGYKGRVTDLVEKALLEERPDRIVACGPRGMYASLSRIVGDAPTEVSLEERMGCGTGGCETCVASVGGRYLKVCTDGPVFNLREVDEFNG